MRKSALLSCTVFVLFCFVLFYINKMQDRVRCQSAHSQPRRVGSPTGRITKGGLVAWVAPFRVPVGVFPTRGPPPGRLCLPQPPGRTTGKTSHRFRKRTPPARARPFQGLLSRLVSPAAKRGQKSWHHFGDNVGDSAPQPLEAWHAPVPVCQVGLKTNEAGRSK